MADKNQLIFEVKAQTSKANSEFKKLGKGVDDVKKKSDSAAEGFGRLRIKTEGLRRGLGAMRNNLLLVTFALGGTIASIKKAVDAFAEQELAEKKLSSALGRTSQALLDQASALQQQTAFGDEAIIGVQSLIAAFTKDEEQIRQLTRTTLDLAAAKGMDLSAAADLVAKSFGSSTNALSRYGIQAEGAAGSTERLTSLTNNAARLFGGQATAQAETMAGALSQAGNAAGDTAEVIGQLLEPLIIRSAKLFKGASEAVTAYLDSLHRLNLGEIESSTDFFKLLGEIEKRTKDLVKAKQDAVRVGYVDPNETPRVKELEGIIAALSERLNEVNILYQDNSLPDWIESHQLASKEYSDFTEKLIKTNDERIKEQEFIERFQEQYPELAASLNLLTNAQKDAKKTQDDLRKSMESTLISSMQQGMAYKNVAKAAQESAQKEIIAQLQIAIAKHISGSFGMFGPIGGAIASATAGAVIGSLMQNAVSGLKSIKFAETGMDEVVNRPTLIMAGENNKAEQVSITPLEGPNIDGPQGGSVTVNVSGNILTQDFVEGDLADAIREATRKGVAFS